MHACHVLNEKKEAQQFTQSAAKNNPFYMRSGNKTILKENKAKERHLLSHLVFKNLLSVKNLQCHRLPCLGVPCKLHFCKCSLANCFSHLIFTHSTLDFRLTHARFIQLFLSSQFCNCVNTLPEKHIKA